MKFIPLRLAVKNGEQVILREAVPKDAAAMIQLVSRYVMESDFLISTLEEFNPTLPEEKSWIQFYNEKRNSLILVAEHGKKLIGNISLRGEQRKKIRHTAVVGIGIVKQWQGQGVGRALLQCAVNWARQSPAVKLLTLTVHADNLVAISLYERMGFKKAGLLPAHIQNADGSFSDDVQMYLPV